MGHWSRCLAIGNFHLAFERLLRGGNEDYKRFFRHHFQAYGLAKDANLLELAEEVRRGRYEPDEPVRVFLPKASGILRPLTLLSVRDQIVYQAIGNVIAEAFQSRQQRHAHKRRFGAIFAGSASPFFYTSWKRSYAAYNAAVAKAFRGGKTWIGDFDLVSFYELIDHNLLGRLLGKRIKDPALIELLFRCLRAWTPRAAGAPVHHGIPQGPEVSAFFAECFLFYLDRHRYAKVSYFRYVDDIKLMGREEAAVRRGLIRLDLASKTLGLVPQAQKISCRQASTLAEIQKTIPSTLMVIVRQAPASGKTQSRLLKMLRRSLSRDRPPAIKNITRFKYALGRLRPRRDILRRIGSLLSARPDLSGVLATYVAEFGPDSEAATTLVGALRAHPVFDAAAANFIDALDTCEPAPGKKRYRRVVQLAVKHSVEHGGVLRTAASAFLARRSYGVVAAALIEQERVPIFQSLLIHRLCEGSPVPLSPSVCLRALHDGLTSEDADYARYCGAVLASCGLWPIAKVLRNANRSVLVLRAALGLGRRVPKAKNVLSIYFERKMRIGMRVDWGKLLGKHLADAESRCIRLQRFEDGDPSSWVLMLDTFNEALIQALSRKHPGISAQFAAGARKPKVLPDFGWWLHQPCLVALLPKSTSQNLLKSCEA
jgi:hypothetical protein